MMELEGILQKCHVHRRVFIMSARVSIPVLFLCSSFEMVNYIVNLENALNTFGLEHL